MPTQTATAAASTQTCNTPTQYEIPVQDAACAVPNNSKYSTILSKCCNSAPVSAYDHDCAIYCLAMGQSVQALTDCLYDAKVDWGDVWCHGNTSATATGTPTATATKTSGAKETGKETGKGKATETKSGGAVEETGESMAGIVSGREVSRVSVCVVGWLVLSSVVGLFN
ncbi:hypothetical protein ANOM_000238 [Aspergillus nomiae NRRL 13137]|uniref:Uncharacterized protein n=1 Tax=Aspergillus nomiae NRRL (strain ATCC 15546 / NRRL 13137 / CBS 260.88 / M93) TaxID=1509407 RepID=A0A0L1JJ36_ASPN3|nr:uncharacterized protein ANOM_000238 [Aspergillus nomiae NRRL 13137]KNG91722.1 hypothetical protein ANOM_000238 [Aspergillus nomiae NRRL 13137]